MAVLPQFSNGMGKAATAVYKHLANHFCSLPNSNGCTFDMCVHGSKVVWL